MEKVLKEHWKLLLGEGILFVILGTLAVILPALSTLSFTLLIGWLLIVSGAVQVYRAFQALHRDGFWWALLSGLLSIIVGGIMVFYPLTGMLSLTLVLAAFFFVEGIFKIIAALHYRPFRYWGWTLFSGIISLILSVMIFHGWPSTALWVLGLLVGINMIFFGWSLIIISLAARRIQ